MGLLHNFLHTIDRIEREEIPWLRSKFCCRKKEKDCPPPKHGCQQKPKCRK